MIYIGRIKRIAFFIALLLVAGTSCAQKNQSNSHLSQIIDENGVTLDKAFEEVYQNQIFFKNGRCYFYEQQYKKDDIEYELDKCQLKYSLQKITKSDRKQGIDSKGKIWIEGNSFRTRIENGVWSKWKTNKNFNGKSWQQRTGYDFKKRNGEFEFTPSIGALKISYRFTYPEEDYSQQQEKDGGIWFFVLAILILGIIVFYVFIIKFLRGSRWNAQSIGTYGEIYTADRVRAITNGIVFQDIYVPGSHDVQQIDVLAVTEKGVLVIEKKTYSGLVVGRAYDNIWRVFYYGQQMYTMKNPHHQNYGHIQALKEKFPELRDVIVGLVIFGDEAELGDDIPSATIRDMDFEYYYMCLPTILNAEQIGRIANSIDTLNIERDGLKLRHTVKINRLNGDW